MAKKGLDRGLDALLMNPTIPSSSKSKRTEENEVEIDINKVEPNREQPRKNFDEDSLLELSESIKQFGVLQPLLVQKRADYYEIIAGERRWRAAKLAKIKKVPVIVRDYSDKEIVEIALIENIQREDLNPIEEAQAYQKLMKEFDMKQDEVAEKVSKSRTAVTNSMRLLKLSSKVQEMLVDDMISSGHARALLSITDKDRQYILAQKIFDQKLSVRDTEKLVKEELNPKPVKTTEGESEAVKLVYQELEEKMKHNMGTKVSIKRKDNSKGKIEIEYYSQDELERLTNLLTN